MERSTKWANYSYADGPFIPDDLIYLTPGLAEFVRKGSRCNIKQGYHIHPKDFATLFSNSKEEEDMSSPRKGDLYEIEHNDTVKYGLYLATNSENKYVFEEKTSGAFVAVEKDKVKKVLPYSVGIKFLEKSFGSTAHSKEYHYLAKEGQVEKGDLLVLNGSFAEVTGVNTENEQATTQLTGWRLSKEKI